MEVHILGHSEDTFELDYIAPILPCQAGSRVTYFNGDELHILLCSIVAQPPKLAKSCTFSEKHETFHAPGDIYFLI